MLCLLTMALPAAAQSRRALAGHVPAVVSELKAARAVPGADHLHLVIGLPLRNQAELDNLIADLHDPASTNYHQWLTPEQFTERFGPSKADYQKIIDFAAANGFNVIGRHSNRMIVDVDAPVSNIESAFRMKLNYYHHPKEARDFYAPDSDPMVATNLPILHVSGLDNYVLPHRIGGGLKVIPFDSTNGTGVTPFATGSGPGGNFMGNDFRRAFVPGVTNTGAGQYIGIVDVGGPYYMKDVYMYETNAGLSTNIVVSNIVTTFTAYWTNPPAGATDDEGEEVLDIDMAMSMAPDAVILNYMGEAHDIFNRIATDNLAKQMTLSYGFGIDATILQIFQQFLAQGQALSQASGDGGADLDGGTGLTGVPYSTIIGGTSLTTTGSGGPYQSENTWGGSGGGISGYGIPTWQQGINMSTNKGSVSFRNYPDVSMPAIDIFTVYRNGTVVGGTGGTSAASPLWAGFMALVNQEAAAHGQSSIGFPNPAIYNIGRGPRSVYTNCFHDIATGNTFNSQNPTRFAAFPGYDLCTGWGTPTGSNTIAALIGTGTNDFSFYPSQGEFDLVAGGAANGNLTLTRMNGQAGSVTFAITGLPDGISATITPATTPTTAALAIATQTNLAPGSYTATITGTLGGISHSVGLTFVISAPVPGSTTVPLSSYYNRAGFWSDGRTFSAGLDGSYGAYSANLLGTSLSWNGLLFPLGSPNVNDVVYCAGQTIPLPAGNYNTLQLLGTGVQGNQSNLTLVVTYTDNSTASFIQSFTDWSHAPLFARESTVFKMPYRNVSSGSSESGGFNLFGYSFPLDKTKTVKSIKLPFNSNVVLLAAALADEPVSASLTGYYNRAGIYSDGVSFTNPATGGIDGGGAAYSATLLTGAQIWSNVLFNFGPANATNVICGKGQTIPLPAGKFAALRMLATGVQGNQVSQSFLITYTDNTTSTTVQSLSDWFSPQNYSGESRAVIMGHRNSSDGSKDNRTFYLYGYSLPVNSGKTIQSIKLPNNASVIVTAISLVPNWEPTFRLNPFTAPDAMAGTIFSGSAATNASDLNGDALTYAKVSGPTWLSVLGNGTLSGTPLSADVGANSFVISVRDSGSLSNTATLNLNVTAAPGIVSTISGTESNLLMSWTGGIAPYQVQMSTNLTTNGWLDVSGTISTNLFEITPSNGGAFYRVIGQ
ncbi:MAG TPA: protease pro-enzyme activation domain-containing protein [Dongiaceae bacterium]|nr:protease pro-enzyme activation domain-containing protein [Dongiaceae bacterium]